MQQLPRSNKRLKIILQNDNDLHNLDNRQSLLEEFKRKEGGIFGNFGLFFRQIGNFDFLVSPKKQS